VGNHLTRIKRKLGVANRLELVLYWLSREKAA
jgi:DNA-binding CsgD family transcriptional regulator